jgi:serine/threonine protein phosphatase PrpC
MHIQQSETSSRRLSPRQRSSGISPFTFAYRTLAHEGHPERNEDTLLVDRRRGLAGVFDGVGGSSAGAVASQLGARIMRQTWRRVLSQAANSSDLLLLNDELDIESFLQQLFEQAQAAISDEGERRAKEAEQANYNYPSTTTVVAALCKRVDEKGYVLGYAHVGDSRAYLLRPGAPLQRLTVDDGYFLLKVQDDTISEEDALRIDQATNADQLSEKEREIFERRNGITQSLGHFTAKKTSITIHTAQTTILPGDRILLCSDGIHDNLTDAEIEATLRHGARTTVARHLVQRALDRSREECLRAKQDDISAVVITCNTSGI